MDIEMLDGAGDEGRMRRITEDAWNEFLPKGEKPASYLLKMEVPVYFKVDAMRHFVCRSQQLLPPIDKDKWKQLGGISWVTASAEELNAIRLQGASVHGGPAYLRLDNASLDELALSGSCKPRFSGCGWVPERTFRESWIDLRRRSIKGQEVVRAISGLMRVEFEEAVLIDKYAWDWARTTGQQEGDFDPKILRDEAEVQWKDLLLDVNDIAKLKQAALDRFELVPYPFSHRVCMPGLFWMFQAAHKFNVQAWPKHGDKKIREWLKDRVPEKAYPYRSMRTAIKFVRPMVGRNQGGKERGEFDHDKIDKLSGNGAGARCQSDLVSEGLSLILAIADYWDSRKRQNQEISRVGLAEILIESKFGGLEVGDIVHLITGEPINDDDEADLKKLIRTESWRDVRDREERQRKKRRMAPK